MQRFLLSFFRLGILALILWVVSFSMAQAQPNKMGPEKMKERFTKEMESTLQALALDEATTAKARQIISANIEQRVKAMKEARENGSGIQGMRQAMEGVNEQTRKELAGILSKDQMKQYRKIQKDRFEARRNRRGRKAQRNPSGS